MNICGYLHECFGQGVVHYMEKGAVCFSRGYSIFQGNEDGGDFSRVGRIPEKMLRRWVSRTRLGSRIIRGGVLDLLPLPDGTLIASTKGTVYVCKSGTDEFMPVLHRPLRTWRLEVVPDGTVYAGEYFSNMRREQVEILSSTDNGASWQSAYLFPAGAIRHIHGICYDPTHELLMVLTGDEDRESMVMTTNDGFRTTGILVQGSQSARALKIIPWEGGYWMATDTPYEQNYAQYLTPHGRILTRVPLAGSCLSASATAGHVFFGTAAEPSKINVDPTAKLYVFDGSTWTVLGCWRADRWSGTSSRRAALFQFARVRLPRCAGESKSMFATPIAVQGSDGYLHRWKF